MSFTLPNSAINSAAGSPYGVMIRESGTSTFDWFFIGKVQVGSGVTQTILPAVSSVGAYIKGTNFLIGQDYDFVFFNPNLYDSINLITPVSKNDSLAFRDGEIGNLHEGTKGSLLNVSTTNPSFGLLFNTFNRANSASNITLKAVGINPQSGFTNADGDVIAANESFFVNLEYQTLAGVATGLVIPNKKNWLTSDGLSDVSSFIPYISKTTVAVVGQTATPTITTSVISTATTSFFTNTVASANIKVFIDGIELVASATAANGLGIGTISITPQLVGKKITVKAQAGSDTISEFSNEITVSAIPVVVTPTSSGYVGSSVNNALSPITANVSQPVISTPQTSKSIWWYITLILGGLLFVLGLVILFMKNIKKGVSFILLGIVVGISWIFINKNNTTQ